MSNKKERSLMSEPSDKESNIKKEQTVGLLEAIDSCNNLVAGLESKIDDIQTKLVPILKTPVLNVSDLELREVDASPTTISVLKLNLKLEKLINILYYLENNVGI